MFKRLFEHHPLTALFAVVTILSFFTSIFLSALGPIISKDLSAASNHSDTIALLFLAVTCISAYCNGLKDEKPNT